MELDQIVKKLVGPINPVGETNEDDKRFENLQTMCELTNKLVAAIDEVAYENRDKVEHSLKKAADYAQDFLTNKLNIQE